MILADIVTEDFESREVVGDVTAVERLVDPVIALAASEVALRLLTDSDSLPYVHQDDGPNAIDIGWWTDHPKSTQTIWHPDHQADREEMVPFLICAKRLMKFANVPDPDYVRLLFVPDPHTLEAHRDPHNTKRTLLSLRGLKATNFPEATINSHPAPPLITDTGGAYQMILRAGSSSIKHEVDYFEPHIALYIDDQDLAN